MRGRILQVSTSPGGVPKLAVAQAYCSPLGLEGDGHNHPRFHGGPQKALLLISEEDLCGLREAGFSVHRGDLGENLTVEGINFRQLRSGQRWRAGEAIIELTTVRIPCRTLDVYNRPGIGRVQDAIYDLDVKAGDPSSPRWAKSGFYAAVFRPGSIRPGDPVTLLEEST